MKTKTRVRKFTTWILTIAMMMTLVPSITFTAYATDPAEVLWGADKDNLTNSGTLAEAIEANAAYIKLQSNIESDSTLTFDNSITLDLNGKTLAADGDQYGVYVSGALTVTDNSITGNGSLIGTSSGKYGVYAQDNITVSGCSLTGESAGTYGVRTYGDIMVSNGSLTGTAEGTDSFGVRTSGITVTGKGSLSGKGSFYGVYAFESSITVSDEGSLTGTGDSIGVNAYGDITVTGEGKLTGTGNNAVTVGNETNSSYTKQSETTNETTGLTTVVLVAKTTTPAVTTYTVTFDANNGTDATDSKTVEDGDSLALTDDIFTYGKCEIESWSTEADGSGYVYSIGEDITVTEDITLYAQWVLPLNKYDSFIDGDYEWSGNTSSPYTFTMKNGATLYASVRFPAQANDDKATIIVNDDCEIKGNVAFEMGTAQGGANFSADLTIKGDGTLKINDMSATSSGDTLTVETDITVFSPLSICAGGGLNSKIVIKDATLTLYDLALLQYLVMEGKAKLNITDGNAGFHYEPEITLSDKSEIYIGGNGYECVLYKEGNIKDAFDALITNEWLPEGYSFKEENYGYYLYDAEDNLETDAITIKKQGCTVIFVDWDGSELDKQTVSRGSAAVAPADPTRDGWRFTGWDKAFDNVTGNLTVTAQYVKNTSSRPSVGGGGAVSSYTIKFETDNGTTVANKYVTRNSKLAVPTAPTKDGYTFAGWYTDKALTSAYDFNSKVTSSFTLYAKWMEAADNTGGNSGHNCPSLNFNDLDITQWYHYDTDYVIGKDIFRGVGKTTFAPNENITRAMMITVLYRAEGEPEVTGGATFRDIDVNAYYAKAVIWGQQNGIIKGYSEDVFAPNQDISREQIAAIMHRYAEFKGYDVSIGESTNILSYDDYARISEYAIPSMQWAVGSGMIKGRTASTLNPTEYATRVEIAAMLHRFLEANK